jgi:hypothetical protein
MGRAFALRKAADFAHTAEIGNSAKSDEVPELN